MTQLLKGFEESWESVNTNQIIKIEIWLYNNYQFKKSTNIYFNVFTAWKLKLINKNYEWIYY